LGLFLVLIAISVSTEEAVHIVQRGETAYSIARRYGVDASEMLSLNGISDPRTLQAGRRLRIPGTPSAAAVQNSGQPDAGTGFIEHRVERGETLYGIARRYEIGLESLRAVNNLSGTSVLREGAVLRIPAPAAPAPEKQEETVRQTVQRTVDQSIRWPVSAREISYMTSKLYGVVLMGERAEPVKSLTQGTVVSAGPYRGFGRVAIIQRTGGYLYVYGGCESLTVKEGDRVNPGTELGRLGVDALTLKPQLFFLVYQNNSPIDPAKAPRT
jgi:murein DD-endopeptidase MepM/ murein hydrolase activator NlpD